MAHRRVNLVAKNVKNKVEAAYLEAEEYLKAVEAMVEAEVEMDAVKGQATSKILKKMKVQSWWKKIESQIRLKKL